MKRLHRTLAMLLCLMLVLVNLAPTVYAHSGRTDSSGGHKDNKNKSGLGSYHYHCGGYPAHLHSNGYCPYRDVFPSRVSISAESDTLRLGKSCPVSATVYPENSCNTHVTWQSSDNSVIKVSGGELIAVGYGTATITASSFNDVVTSVTITVLEVPVEAVAIAALALSDQSVDIGDTRTLSASVEPEDADLTDIIWTSSDESIATVSGGVVTAVKEGNVTITASTANGTTDSVEITVTEVVAESIDLVAPETIIIGESSEISATVNPSNTSYPAVEWESSNSDVISVDEYGNLEAVGVGIATISAIQKDIKTGIDIEVLPIDVEYIDMSHDTLEEELGIDETLQFYATAYPKDATYPNIIWATSDPDIAVIDEDGLLTTTGAGEVTVYARTSDGAESSIVLKVKNKLIPVLIGGAGGTAAIGGIVATVKKKKKNT